jgi:hypothetical protein
MGIINKSLINNQSKDKMTKIAKQNFPSTCKFELTLTGKTKHVRAEGVSEKKKQTKIKQKDEIKNKPK